MQSFRLKNKIAKLIFIAAISCSLFCSCNNNSILKDKQADKMSVNSCIEKLNMDYEDITELTCTSGDDFSLLGNNYDLLQKLTNLEKIKFVGIGTKDDAQKFFSELIKLEKLNSIEIIDSRIGSIDKLGEIKNLENLSIIGNINGGSWFSIDDIDLLWNDDRFKNLKSLSLKFINLTEFPNLSNLKQLNSLAISGREINFINTDSVEWSQLTSLEVSNTSVSALDSDIINQLSNLRNLDISYSKFENTDFVNMLTQIETFKCDGYSEK